MPKAKFKISEIPKTFPSKEEKEAVVNALNVEHSNAKASVVKLQNQLNVSENHFNQVASALSAARHARVFAKKDTK